MGETVSEKRNLNQLGEYAQIFKLKSGDEFPTPDHSYKLLDCIGEGGMAQVWRARSDAGDVVAIKFIRQLMSSDEAYRLRLKKEAALAKEMNHPNVVNIIAFVDDEEQSFIVMEYVTGGDLHEYMHEELGMTFKEAEYELPPSETPKMKTIDVNKATRIIKGIADVYVNAQLAGKRILHRDLKPENILLDDRGNPKLSDFGIAKDLDATTQLTKSGMTPGTFLYMAPERITEEDEVTVQSDMYSLGVLLYYMVVGRPPFYAEDTNVMLDKHCEAQQVEAHLLNPEVSPELSRILDCLLAKSPKRRFDPAGLVAALQRLENGREPEYPPAFLDGPPEPYDEPGQRRYLLLIAAVLAIIAAIAVSFAILLVTRRSTPTDGPTLADPLPAEVR